MVNHLIAIIRKAILPISCLITLIALSILSNYYTFPLSGEIRTVLIILTYIIIGWFVSRVITYVFTRALTTKYEISKKDNLYERKMQTKLKYLRATLNIVVWIIVVALIFSLFPALRTFGSSLLISAGITSIIIGFAAQRSIANIIAGFQIAFSQPIRIDDAVLVEDEWGWIEEITLTYVVVRIWDKRRLVLPINYFVEKPFQNWTRTSADILGSIFLYVDYSVPVDALRKELKNILSKEKLWDKKVSNVQVVDTTEKAVKLRILVSAGNSPDTWDLRCLVREKLISFLQKKYPESLPKLRAELTDKKD